MSYMFLSQRPLVKKITRFFRSEGYRYTCRSIFLGVDFFVGLPGYLKRKKPRYISIFPVPCRYSIYVDGHKRISILVSDVICKGRTSNGISFRFSSDAFFDINSVFRGTKENNIRNIFISIFPRLPVIFAIKAFRVFSGQNV